MKPWTRDDDLEGRPACRCHACGLTLVDVPEVGWVACEPGGTYDLCTCDALGNHDPDTRQQHPFRATQVHRASVGTA